MSETVATCRFDVAADHPAFDGHFPGRPVLPGVALLAAVLEAADTEPRLAACIGAAPRLSIVKFLAPVGPGASLDIVFRLGERTVEWRVKELDRDVATGQIARADLAVPSSG
jgi:3-hydroxymyristoyl/3-hydroxydecanoyl-(acyl carrier protein) dehydratase